MTQPVFRWRSLYEIGLACKPCVIYISLFVRQAAQYDMRRRSKKYQLSIIDPRDGTVLQTELHDYCDKLVDERRSSEVLSTQLIDDGAVYHVLSVHLSRAESITRFDDRCIKAKFSKSESGTKFQREVPLFLELPEFSFNRVQDMWKETPVPKTQRDRHRQTERHRAMASTRASIVWRGKKQRMLKSCRVASLVNRMEL